MRYCKSTIFQANHNISKRGAKKANVVCDTAKVRFFKQITTMLTLLPLCLLLFAILQKYDFSSKSQPVVKVLWKILVVCDTAKVRFFKQITTNYIAIKSENSCLRYCKSTIFQANHNPAAAPRAPSPVVCDTAKVRFFKQITTTLDKLTQDICCLRYCKSTIFQANHN